MIDLFAKRGTLVPKDVTPFQNFSGKGMKFRLQSYDWDGCACVSHMSMRAFFGLMTMETVICTPYTKDLPLFSFDGVKAFGKTTLIVEFYDTLLAPVDLSVLERVRQLYKDLKNKAIKPAWYDSLKLPPSTYKVGRGARMSQLATEMATAYLDLFANARDVDRAEKTARNRAYVEGLITNGGPAINTVRDMLGAAPAETMFRRFLFGTE